MLTSGDSGFEPVHPRLRGELVMFNVISPDARGSSPLARGTLNVMTTSLVLFRFIPACAGNSPTRAIRAQEFSVHPRLRGELQLNPLQAL